MIPFMTNEQQQDNLAKQLSMTPQTMEQLRRYGVDDSKTLKLEYFFFTDAEKKAEGLAEQLSVKGYTCDFGQSASDESLQVITGWTSPMQMSLDCVLDWTKLMCELATEFDCEFDGWGTNPEQ